MNLDFAVFGPSELVLCLQGVGLFGGGGGVSLRKKLVKQLANYVGDETLKEESQIESNDSTLTRQ